MSEIYDPISERPAFGTPSEIEENPGRGIPRAMPAGFETQHAQPESAAPSMLVAAIADGGVQREVTDAFLELQSGESLSPERRAIEDQVAHAEGRAELLDLWGSDEALSSNIEKINTFVDTLGEEAANFVRYQGRTSDGRPLGSDPAFLQKLLGLAGKPRPEAKADVKGRVGEIEKFMRTNRRDYNRDNLLQAEYRSLIRVREAMG